MLHHSAGFLVVAIVYLIKLWIHVTWRYECRSLVAQLHCRRHFFILRTHAGVEAPIVAHLDAHAEAEPQDVRRLVILL